MERLAPIFRLPANHSATDLTSECLHSELRPSEPEGVNFFSSIDEDPNEGRRKRQRKEYETVNTTSVPQRPSAVRQGDQSQMDMNWSPHLQGPTNTSNIFKQPAQQPLLFPQERQKPQLVASGESYNNGLPSDELITTDSNESLCLATAADQTVEMSCQNLPTQHSQGVTPKRKILKLTADGKLRSPPKRSELNTNESRSRGRQRDLSESLGSISKLVIIRYNVDHDASLGSKIEDILTGKKSLATPSDSSAEPKKTKTKRATHPFFLGKPKENPPIKAIESPASLSVQTIHGIHTSVPQIQHPRPQITTYSRNPDAMLPIWPPFSLGTKRIPKADHTRLSPRYSKESNKLKYIASSELERNSLLDRISSSLLGYHGQLRSENSIRVPVRKLVSGHKCLEGIDVVGNGGMVDRVGYVHPAIRKLRTTLLQSTPAFDRGEFETIAWINKYAPEKAEEVLQGGTEPVFLRDWIRSLSVSAVDDGSTKSRPRSQGLRKALRKKKRAKRAKDGLDEFIISSEDEDSELNEIEWSEDDRSSMSGTSLKRSAFRNIRLGSRQGSHDTPKNTILLSGPHGSGKTATVYAVAKELGFEIFEINAGSRRSAKDILDKVGDMTHNHLVQQCESNLDPNEVSSTIDEGSMQMEVSTGRQASMSAFLESKPRPVEAKKRCHPKQENHLEKRSSKTSQKQSLILIEEADILYDEDRSFWSTVTTLAAQSKRPIVITCTDEELVPFGDLTLEAILRFGSPPLEAATEYLSLLAACEGHLFDKARVQRLYQCKGHDLRATIMELNFWCQMGVGSNKGGLDWMVNKNEEVVTNRSDEKLRITSFGTFEEDMSFIPNQASVTSNVESGVEIEQDLMLFADEQLEVPAIDWVSRLEESMESDISSLSVDAALRLSQWASDLDVLYWSGDRNSRGQGLDMTQPDLSARARSSYCEGYPLLEAFESHSYSDNSAKMTAAIFTLLRPDITSRQICGTQSIMDRIAQSSTNAEIPIDRKFAETLSFLDTAHPVFPPPTGRLAPSLENCLATLITDVAPYVRYIMSYDDHLEQQREGLLDALSSQEGGTRGKGRTTRASRAALEGGRKDETRREKWFHVSPDHEAVVATAGNGWQEALLDELNQMNIQDTTEPEK